MAKRDDKKVNLLHLVETLGMGGAEMMLLHYIRALGNEHYKHHIYCFGFDGPIRELIEKLGVPVIMGPKCYSIKHPIKFTLSIFVLVKNLMSFIQDNRIQVIQSHAGRSNELAVVIGKLSGVVAFPTIHSTMAFVDTRSIRDPRVCLRKALNWVIYRISGQVIAVSQEIKDIICQSFRLEESKVLVLKNGIIFDEGVSEPVDLKKEIFDSSNKLKLIAVGRLVPLKGFDILIKAVAEVVNQGFDDLLVLIVGGEKPNGGEQSRLQALIRNLNMDNYVRLLGLRHDVIGLMKACDIFVLPSRYEGLSLAMIEAMACGLPIVASNGPGLKDFISDLQNGLLFPVDDHMVLAKCILRLAEDKDLRIQLSRGARVSFEKNYDVRKNIAPLAALIQKYAFETKNLNKHQRLTLKGI